MEETPLLNQEPHETKKDFRMAFHGTSSEYFKIWIVNIALTVLTLGIYYPWAKVRTRRYFYANTELDEHRFDYLAKPKQMLKGYLIIYSAIIVYILGLNNIISPIIGGIVLFSLVALGPFLITSSLRFRLFNTSYRNVRFNFGGRVGDAYAIYWGYGLLTYITAGIMFPILKLKIFDFIFDNASLGKTPFAYKGKGGPMYRIYFPAFIIAVVFGGIAMTAAVATGSPEYMLIIFYGLYFIGFPIISGLIGALTLKYNLSVLTLGYEKDLSFNSDLNTGKYVVMTVTNFFATVLSLGLLSPWAKVRASKMIFSSISVTSQKGDLGSHESLAESEQTATGEAAVDALDFDVGF